MLKHIERISKIYQDDSTSWGEKMLLYWLIRETRPRVVVETGTHKGATTYVMAQAVCDNGIGEIHTYDPNDWGVVEEGKAFPELSALVTYHQCRGDEMEVDGIDFAFIDGLHEDYEVRKELGRLLPRLNQGAVVVFHDCWPAVDKTRADVNSALDGLTTTWLPTSHALRIYTHGEMYDKPDNWSLPGAW